MTQIRSVRTRWGERGFTLVEVLAVLAVLGVLAGLALGAYASSRRQGQYNQAQAQGLEVFMALDSFLVRNVELSLDLASWTRSWPAGSLEGAPEELAGVSGYDCQRGATLSRGGLEPGSQSWGAAPGSVGCLIERVGDRFLVHTWVKGLPRHFVNGRPQP